MDTSTKVAVVLGNHKIDPKELGSEELMRILWEIVQRRSKEYLQYLTRYFYPLEGYLNFEKKITKRETLPEDTVLQEPITRSTRCYEAVDLKRNVTGKPEERDGLRIMTISREVLFLTVDGTFFRATYNLMTIVENKTKKSVIERIRDFRIEILNEEGLERMLSEEPSIIGSLASSLAYAMKQTASIKAKRAENLREAGEILEGYASRMK